jgi:hypothetical protein
VTFLCALCAVGLAATLCRDETVVVAGVQRLVHVDLLEPTLHHVLEHTLESSLAAVPNHAVVTSRDTTIS